MNKEYYQTLGSVKGHITAAFTIILLNIFITITISEIVLALLIFAAVDIIFYLLFD